MGVIGGFAFLYILVLVLKAVIVFFLVSLLLLFVTLGIHKIRIQGAEDRSERNAASYRTALAALGAQPVHLDAPGSAADAIDLANAVAAAGKDAPAEGRVALRQAALEAGIVKVLRTAVHHRSWGNRYRALTAFYDLAAPGQFGFLLDFASGESDRHVYGNALMACAACVGSIADFDAVLRLAQDKMEISASYYEGIFRTGLHALRERVGRDRAIEYLKGLFASPAYGVVVKAPLVHAVAKEQLKELKPSILMLTRREPDTVITIAVLRALGIFKEYDEIIFENLGKEPLPLTVVALGACRACTDPGPVLLEAIVRQLYSANYTVRAAAAATLKHLGREGRRALEDASVGEDKYAGDISSYVLSLG